MKTVMVVEDEAPIAEVIRYNLEREGFAVTIVGDGERAVASATASPPDLVILDLLLPGLDGWTVASQLRENGATASVPILVLSIVADRARGLAAGATDYLTKPFSMLELIERVRRLVR